VALLETVRDLIATLRSYSYELAFWSSTFTRAQMSGSRPISSAPYLQEEETSARRKADSA
jgi:hypothetical protein